MTGAAANVGSVAETRNVERVELYLVCQRLKVVVRDEMRQFGIDPSKLNSDAAINSTAIRNAMIRDEFAKDRRLGVKAERLYCDLSLKHGLSFDYVVDIVKGKE